MTEKRYSVWGDDTAAMAAGPDHKTWQEAEDELGGLRKSIIHKNWRIWLHNDDGTVVDVTDGEPEQWWCTSWDTASGFKTYVQYPDYPFKRPFTRITFEGGKADEAVTWMLSTTDPTPEAFQAHVLAETGVEVPCVEEARWWWWDIWAKEWREGNGDYPYCNRDSVRVWATESTRDQKRDALLAAARAAGKPEEAS